MYDEFTDVRLHGEPAEGQTPAIGVFLELLEYLIGLRVVSYAARNQMDLSTVCTWSNAELMITTI